MASAGFTRVAKSYGDVAALDDFNLAVDDGELIAVLGPSGCGKSTLLRLAAGLESLSRGEIRLDGRRIDTLPPQDRDVAMVFQGYALYPHMRVRENIEFPLRMRGVAREPRRRRVEETAALLALSGLLDRRPADLSGGERQRVALARALVREPALFLLDEPLSNLDAKLRTSVRQHIRDVQRRLAVTCLYVTHDQTEAMALGHRVLVVDRGRIQQVGAPLEVYERPANTFVASFVGAPSMNLLAGEYSEGTLRVGDQRVAVGAPLRERLGAAERRVVVGVRPEAFRPADSTPAGALLAFPEPETRELLGGEILLRARLGGERLTVRLFGASGAVPSRVAALASSLHVFATGSGERLGP